MLSRNTKHRTLLPGLPNKIQHTGSYQEYYITTVDSEQNTIYLQPVEGDCPIPFVLTRVWGQFGLTKAWRECK